MIKKATFIQSAANFQQCPQDGKPEYAFIGRSNVGKSSLINMLTGQKHLAKVSATPGKTQLINHFLINDEWYLVDLPGYGWAKTSKTNKEKWSIMTREYLLKRESLITLFVLIDSRHSPQSIDIQFIDWLGEEDIPFSLVFTKSDKQSQSKTAASVKNFLNDMLQKWEGLPDYFVTSSVKNHGKSQITEYIESLNGQL